MKQRYSRGEIVFILVAGLAVLIMLAAFLAMNLRVVQTLQRGGDFLVPWKAARAFLFEKGQPYSGDVAAYVQQRIYGRNAQPGEKPYILTTPFYLLQLNFITPVLEHLVHIFAPQTSEDGSIPTGIFLFLSEAALLAMMLLAIRLTDWQPRRLFSVALLLLLPLGFYSLWALIEASPAILFGLIYAGMLVALRLEMDELVGALLAISFYRWDIGGPFLFLLLLWVFAQRRWRVISGLFMTLFVLVVVSFFVYPGWLMPYLRAVLVDAKWDYGFTTASILTRLWPTFGRQAGLGLSLLVAVLLAVEWSGARTADFRRLYWAACLSLAAAPLAGWRFELQSLVVLLIPLIFILAVIRERWKAGYLWSGLFLLLFCGLPWFFLLGDRVPAALRLPLIYLFLPVLTVIGLYWTRWWALRPARTWLERASLGEYR